MRKAIFLDRDGVINKVILKDDRPFSPRSIAEFELSDDIEQFLARSRQVGFMNIVITNQPDIARGLISWDVVEAMHLFIKKNLPVDDIFVCPHDDMDNCNCRKPKHGMLLEAAEKWDIDLTNSFLIGDQWKDMEAGKSAGCITILLEFSYNRGLQSDFIVKDLRTALKIIKPGEQEALKEAWTAT
jgi:D-glycero-D-manno-heptose 1,7-bisphosphate phosphatase